MNKISVSVIIAVHNEVETLENEVKSLYKSIVSKIPNSEFIIAEDGSTDGSKEIIKKLIKEIGVIHSTSDERKGYTKALRDAFQIAKSPIIFFSDTGNKHDPEEFWDLYAHIDDYDLIIGKKVNRTDQFYRRILSKSYNIFISKLFNFEIEDADSGFRIYKKELMEHLLSEKWIFHDLVASELTIRSFLGGYGINEVPISYNQRIGISRGLPLNKIPKVIIRSIIDLWYLYKQYK